MYTLRKRMHHYVFVYTAQASGWLLGLPKLGDLRIQLSRYAWAPDSLMMSYFSPPLYIATYAYATFMFNVRITKHKCFHRDDVTSY